jgi:hypothetical protein
MKQISIEKKPHFRLRSDLRVITEGKGRIIFNTHDFLAIYNRVLRVRPDARRQWGKMNLVQALNHLKVSTGSGILEYHLKDESSFLWRTVIKFLVIYILKRLPKNAKAAEGFKIEMDNALDFDTEKEQVLDILQKAYFSTSETYPHPLFGTMSGYEWGTLVYRHFDHHLRQFGA